ncbi:hypothetical protein AB0I28_01995 [Phytomonospora sp. NPDC050363]|uniref:hypothetical protein n=1 Tax=Phytomonospora sp. NPDC050363 TaxID=3155642 RepID=UPI0033FC05A6
MNQRLLTFLRPALGLLAVLAAQWTLRLGAREAALVEWDCGGGRCGTNDFAGAAPVLGVLALVAGAYLLLPKSRRALAAPLVVIGTAVCVVIGLEEGIAEGNIERDGDSYFFMFGGLDSRNLEIAMAVLAVAAVAVWAFLAFRGAPRPSVPRTETAAESAPAMPEPDREDERTARVIAQLTRLRESGEIDGPTYDLAVAKLMR